MRIAGCAFSEVTGYFLAESWVEKTSTDVRLAGQPKGTFPDAKIKRVPTEKECIRKF